MRAWQQAGGGHGRVGEAGGYTVSAPGGPDGRPGGAFHTLFMGRGGGVLLLPACARQHAGTVLQQLSPRQDHTGPPSRPGSSHRHASRESQGGQGGRSKELRGKAGWPRAALHRHEARVARPRTPEPPPGLQYHGISSSRPAWGPETAAPAPGCEKPVKTQPWGAGNWGVEGRGDWAECENGHSVPKKAAGSWQTRQTAPWLLPTTPHPPWPKDALRGLCQAPGTQQST